MAVFHTPVRLIRRTVARLSDSLRPLPDLPRIDNNSGAATGVRRPDGSGNGHAGGLAVRRKFESFGERTIEIVNVRIVSAHSGTSSAAPGELVFLSIRIVAHIDEPNLTVGMEISDSFGEIVFGTNTYHHNRVLSVVANREYELKYVFRANLNRGRYSIGATLHTGADHSARCFHWCDNITEFDVVQMGEPDFIGYCRLEPEIEWSDAPARSLEPQGPHGRLVGSSG
jgi:lipopolysaccharide transport system ATP-binding protein